jgi:hypothetical protein
MNCSVCGQVVAQDELQDVAQAMNVLSQYKNQMRASMIDDKGTADPWGIHDVKDRILYVASDMTQDALKNIRFDGGREGFAPDFCPRCLVRAIGLMALSIDELEALRNMKGEHQAAE